MAFTETQKKLAEEVAEGAPSTDAARKNLEIDPPAEEPNNIDGAPSYPEPKQKTPEEMGTNPKEFLDRLDDATQKAPEKELSARLGRLYGSAGSLEAIKQVIGQFYQSRSIQLPDNGDGTWDVHNANGKIEGVRVVRKDGRYRFEEVG